MLEESVHDFSFIAISVFHDRSMARRPLPREALTLRASEALAPLRDYTSENVARKCVLLVTSV